MNQSDNYCQLNHAKLFSIPIINNLGYLFQIVMLMKNLSNVYFASNRQCMYRDILFSHISRKYSRIFCRSLKFGRTLRIFSETTVIINIHRVNLKQLNKHELYTAMWSLVFSKYVTHRSKSALNEILPPDFPTINASEYI